jgi:hypothetical protein
MTQKIDDDLMKMDLLQVRREAMRLRTAFRIELNNTGNRRCWVNLLKHLPEGKSIEALSLPRAEFLGNCARYYDRNQS